MRRLIILFPLMTLLMISNVQSQTASGPSGGSKAILFDFVGLSNLSLDAYQGGIGGKYFLSNELAIRAMLQFGVDDKTTKSTPEITDNTITFGIGGALEYHLPIMSKVSPYVGGGLFFNTSTETANPGSSKTTASIFGLGALGGVEYFFNQNLSLGAEYMFGLTSTSTSPPEGPKQSEFTLGFQTAGLTLAVYF